MVKQVVPLQPMEDRVRADIHTAAHRGPHAGAGVYALKEAAACGKPVLEQGRSVRRKGWQRCSVMNLNDKPHSSCTAQGGQEIEELEMKE